jgi:hypothetical protein
MRLELLVLLVSRCLRKQHLQKERERGVRESERESERERERVRMR